MSELKPSPFCGVSDTNRLPTAEEYRATTTDRYNTVEWTEPKYQCHKCGGGMCKNLMVICTCIPPKYEYRCNKCGHIEYQFR